eukprot:COSAG04_NODE_936_length_9333_cov_16.898635_2_plen_163_part_00
MVSQSSPKSSSSPAHHEQKQVSFGDQDKGPASAYQNQSDSSVRGLVGQAAHLRESWQPADLHARLPVAVHPGSCHRPNPNPAPPLRKRSALRRGDILDGWQGCLRRRYRSLVRARDRHRCRPLPPRRCGGACEAGPSSPSSSPEYCATMGEGHDCLTMFDHL